MAIPLDKISAKVYIPRVAFMSAAIAVKLGSVASDNETNTRKDAV